MNNSFLFDKIRIYIKRIKNKKKIRNYENNRLLYSFIKIKLLLLALILFFILIHNILNFKYTGSVLSQLNLKSFSEDIVEIHKLISSIHSYDLLCPSVIKLKRARIAQNIGARGEMLAGYLAGMNQEEQMLLISNIKIFYPQSLSELVEKEKIVDSHLTSNTSCFSTENKLYWKNQTNLEIEKLRNDIRKIQTSDIFLNNNFRFYRSINPKISLIITVYNQDHYIKMIYASIQQQELKDIEIIFIDDASTDNSSFIIKDLMKLDKRISYIKNNINKKQFYSINLGVLYSNGEYILSIDPDDLLLNNILIKVYKTSKYYNLDILQFYMLSGMNLLKKN